MKKKILVVAAHPDDEVLGCGATIAKHVLQSDKVWVLILGEGITSRKNLSEKNKIKLLENLKHDCLQADKLLGVEKTILKSFPDNRFDSVPLINIIQEIEDVLNSFKPSIVYTHSLVDVNIDHKKTIEAIQSACRPVANNSVEQILSFETPSSSEWNFIRQPFFPKLFCEISEKQIDQKIRALKLFKFEIRKFPHPRSGEYLRALAMVRGAQSGFKLAEAFEVVRSFKKE